VKPDEAAVFTFKPLTETSMQGGVGLADEVGTVAEHLCAIRLINDNKVLRLSTDGHVTMQAVQESDVNIRNTRITASIEQLLVRGKYEIEVEQQQIGIILSKDTPLRVVGLSHCPVNRANAPPALGSGRVHVGDILSSVSGQDVSGIPCADVLMMISCKRPVTIGFTVPPSGEPALPVGKSSSSDTGYLSPVKRSSVTVPNAAASFFGFGKRTSRPEKPT